MALVVWWLFTPVQDTTDYYRVAKGRLLDISFSGVRVNQESLVNVLVKYEGIKKEFEHLERGFELNFKPGDYVIVRYLAEDKLKSKVDVAESKKIRARSIDPDVLVKEIYGTEKSD